MSAFRGSPHLKNPRLMILKRDLPTAVGMTVYHISQRLVIMQKKQRSEPDKTGNVRRIVVSAHPHFTSRKREENIENKRG